MKSRNFLGAIGLTRVLIVFHVITLLYELQHIMYSAIDVRC